MVIHFTSGLTPATLYTSVSTTLKIFQTAALLEVLHAVVGLVRSNPVVAAQQVASRVYIVWFVLNLLPPSRLSVGVLFLLFAWTITEIIRYSMYAISQVTSTPYLLTWLRYTFFIVAYPVGVSGELLVSYAGLNYAKSEGILSVSLPNSLNVTFNYHLLMIMVMLVYIPGFPPMYLHMFGQRKKILGDEKKA
jgi:very-long-chain (3R)-3-hydroxyacyl-CoA dehydratase